jgi:hypothetical protein
MHASDGPSQAKLKTSAFGFGIQQRRWIAAERRHPTDRERMGLSALHTIQDPILLLPWVLLSRWRGSKP